MTRDPESLLCVSCATCGRELLGESEWPWLDAQVRACADLRGVPPLVAGRRHGRPYCWACCRAFDYAAGRQR
jgi:hypothetical protein